MYVGIVSLYEANEGRDCMWVELCDNLSSFGLRKIDVYIFYTCLFLILPTLEIFDCFDCLSPSK